LFVTFPEKTFAQDKPETIYQCAPCACSSDDKHFDKPGSCPSCGMKLVAVTEPFNSLKDLDKPMNVAILLFNHAQVLDYAGPYDVFTSAGRKNFNVYTVASTKEAITTMPNLSVNPDYTFSVCTGAFILAEIGILDGLEATTHSAGIDILEKKYPAIKKVHSNMRFVDNGNVITSAGVSAGIDASFHLIVKILGEDWAEAIATNLEYKYEPHKSPNKHN
jgi:transcriptional regulator GlxA family with amidase domain/DNA-directed RNA polymerase subunit RPC12/RpoP